MREPLRKKNAAMTLFASIVVGAVMAGVLFRIFFDDLNDFIDCVRLHFTPEIISVFRGEWHDNLWAYTKLKLLKPWSA